MPLAASRLWVKRDDLTGLGMRREQGAQARVPVRRSGGRPGAGSLDDGRRRAVEPLSDDRGRRGRPRPRGAPGAGGRPTTRAPTGNLSCSRCHVRRTAPLHRAPITATGASSRSRCEHARVRRAHRDQGGGAVLGIPIGGSARPVGAARLRRGLRRDAVRQFAERAGFSPAAIVHTSRRAAARTPAWSPARALHVASGSARGRGPRRSSPSGWRKRRDHQGTPDVAALAAADRRSERRRTSAPRRSTAPTCGSSPDVDGRRLRRAHRGR